MPLRLGALHLLVDICQNSRAVTCPNQYLVCHENFGPRKNWSNAENFCPAMDQFSMEYCSGGPVFSGKISPGDYSFKEYWSRGPFFQGYWSGRLFFHGILIQETNFFWKIGFMLIIFKSKRLKRVDHTCS